MSQLSPTTLSYIGEPPDAVYLTLDGTDATRPVLTQFETAGWNPLVNTEDECLEAVEVQQVYVGGESGTDGFEVLLTIRTLRASVYAKLLAQRNTPATVFPALLTLAETDLAGDERVLEFERLAWISLDFNRKRRIAAGFVFEVEARLRSVN